MSAPPQLSAEILPWDPATPPPVLPEAIDVTRRVRRQAIGTINRAVERDFLSFRTGDVTLSLLNRDGYLDDLFSSFKATDRWQFRISDGDRALFRGIMLGQGSINFDVQKKIVEVTVYGPTRLLMDASAETVKRVVADTTVTTATSGQLSMTVASTAGYLSGDVLHVTDQKNAEDVTIKMVTSATVVSLEAALINTYAAGSTVSLSTPFYRYKTIDFLVRQLIASAGVSAATVRVSQAQFRRLAPTLVNLSGLPAFSGTSNDPGNQAFTYPSQRSGRRYESLYGDGTYYQSAPDAAWVKEDSTVQSWVDWSRYYPENSPEPAVLIRSPFVSEAESAPGGGRTITHNVAWDFISATKNLYYYRRDIPIIYTRTSADGVTWSAAAILASVGLIGSASNSGAQEMGCEVDVGRGLLYFWSGNTFNGDPVFGTYDLNTTTQTSLRQAGDTFNANRYGGFVYVPELDCVIGLRTLSANGQSGPDMYGRKFNIIAFRGNAKLWERPFPDCFVPDYGGGTPAPYYNFPTHSLRYVRGALYCVAICDGRSQLIVSDDQFQSYTVKPITDPGVGARLFAARVNGAYQITGWSGTAQRGHLIAAPFYAGVVAYADFTNLSVAEALRQLAVLTNSIFYVDDEIQAYFLSRDSPPSDETLDITPMLKGRRDVLIWEESHPCAVVSGNNLNEKAGDTRFIGHAADISSQLLPNAAYAAALAKSYADFYSPDRRQSSVVVKNPDATIYYPLRRVIMDGVEYQVLESDYELSRNQSTLKLVQRVQSA